MILRKATELSRNDIVVYRGEKRVVRTVKPGVPGWIKIFFKNNEYKINLHVDDMVEVDLEEEYDFTG